MQQPQTVVLGALSVSLIRLTVLSPDLPSLVIFDQLNSLQLPLEHYALVGAPDRLV